MTEREAEEFAAKLTRIWMPDGSFGVGAIWELRGGRFNYTARMTDELEMWFGESSICGGLGYHLKRIKDGQTIGYWYCGENEGCVRYASQTEEGEGDPPAFAEMYIRLMRSHCWLSGCPVEVSLEEQERWTLWQREREEEGRGEPTNTVEWEVQRVAAALGVEAVAECRNATRVHYEGWLDDVLVTWEVGDPNAKVKNIYVGTRSYCGVCLRQGRWEWEAGHEGREPMARGLYRLGIEDENVLAQLNVPLSMHEQMELRLSMPREFWPQKWRDEVRKE